ncbi:conjugative relaxase [Salmonella enterica]|nr:conjugative relaxase [Salmonella enterica]EHR6310845.1 conjugative relaxase [Salmonella enterica]
MLSVSKVKSVAQASSYYNSPDQYYDKDSGDITSRWGGNGAEQLGLEGPVSPEDFVRLLEGRISPDVQLGKNGGDGTIEHVPAWDFTLSAPKSVSVLALVGNDKRLIDAHIKATAETMKFIEKEYALTRISNGGTAEYTKVNNLVYASYIHTESRKHDPQLHSHNVVMNAVMDDSGQWRSLETLKMYENQLGIGLVYRSHLAKLVKQIGYDLEIDHESGLWDIKGVPHSLMDTFSKRRKEVLEAANQYGLFDAKSMEKAALFSRDSKTHVEYDELKASWEETVRESGISLDDVINRSYDNIQPGKPLDDTHSIGVEIDLPEGDTGVSVGHGNSSLNALERQVGQEIDFVTPDYDTKFNHKGQGDGVEIRPDSHFPDATLSPEIAISSTERATDKYAREYISQQDLSSSELAGIIHDVRLAYKVMAADEAVFTHDEVLKEATRLALGNALPGDIEQVLRAMINSGELLPRIARKGDGEAAYTTPAAFEKEREMVLTMLSGKESRQAAGDIASINAYIDKFEAEKTAEFGSAFAFSSDQRLAIVDAATNKDLVSGIQGFAGTGKTTLLQCLIGYGESKGFSFKGLAPTGSATETLAKETGIPASTVDSFLFRRMKGTVSSREIWLVDEASLVGADNQHALIMEAERSDAKLLLLGDKKQMESVDWGRPFAVLQGFGMRTSSVQTIIRQKDEQLRAAVYDSISGNFSQAFSRLKNSVYDMEKHSVLADYLALSQAEREKTLVIIPDNEGRQAFNQGVHEKRVQDGELSASEVAVRGLLSANLNEAERTDSRYYKSEHIIEFQLDHGEFKKGEFWKVADASGKELLLKNADGQKRKFNPSEITGRSKFAIDVFREGEILLSEQEKVIFTKSRKDLNVRNGDEFTVSRIDPATSTFTLINAKGKELSLDSTQLHSISHSYAMTTYKAQGKTVDRVMAQIESWRRNLVNERSFYVNLSRARYEARLYVDNVGKVVEALSKHDANKTTSLTGFSVKNMKRAAEQLQAERTDTRQLYADLNIATQKLANKQGVFSHSALVAETLKNTLGTYDVRDIETAIYAMRMRGEVGLSHINHDKLNSENYYTMPQNIRHEAQIVRHMLQGKDRYAAIAGKSVVSRFLSAREDKARQGIAEPVSAATQAALTAVMTSRDESILITGSDLSGHRDVMRELGKDIAKERGYRVKGFSTTAEGVKQMRESMKFSSNIYQHLDQMETKIAAGQTVRPGKELWVVENVSQMGAENLIRLQQAARYVGARMVLVADRQENSIAWGNMPSLLAEQGIATIDFDKANRSLNPEINQATDKLTQGKIEDALAHISPMMSEVRDLDNQTNDRTIRLNVIAKAWLNLAPADRTKTAVVIPDYFSRNKVDVQIRRGLQSEGVLQGSALTTAFYRNANLDPFEKKVATNYKPGQVVQFESQRPGIEKGAYYTVEAVNKSGNELILVSVEAGHRVTINASEIAGSRNNSVQVFHVEQKQVQKGETLRFTRTVPADKVESADGKGVSSKMIGTVEALDGTKLTLRLANNRLVTVDAASWKHMEWGYTNNMFNIKDKQFDNVITLMESWKKQFATQEALHNALTKTAVNLRIVTDDKAKLLDSLRSTPGFRQTALHDRKVSITKSDMAAFDKQFGTGLGFGMRSLMKLEAAVDKAVTTTMDKVIQKSQVVGEKVSQFTRQKSL